MSSATVFTSTTLRHCFRKESQENPLFQTGKSPTASVLLKGIGEFQAIAPPDSANCDVYNHGKIFKWVLNLCFIKANIELTFQ